jgi:hypothetical protein
MNALWVNFKRYVFPTLQTISIGSFFILPLWFTGWYPNAEATLKRNLKVDANEPINPTFSNVFFESIFDWGAPPIYTAIILAVSIVSQISSYRVISKKTQLEEDLRALENKNSDITEKLNDEQEGHSDTRKHYYASIKTHLIRICTRIDRFDPNSCRASIYRLDHTDGVARLVFRYCGLTKYERMGRHAIPLREGVLGATVQNGDSAFITVQQRNYQKSIDKALLAYEVVMSNESHNAIKMKSRTYYGRAIKKTEMEEKIAVIIIESLETEAFNKEQLDKFFSENSSELNIWIGHMVRMNEILNPFGGKNES